MVFKFSGLEQVTHFNSTSQKKPKKKLFNKQMNRRSAEIPFFIFLLCED